MHCTLLVPELLPAPGPDGSPYHDLQVPALTRLLARARCRSLGAFGTQAWLCNAFGVERQHDWPVAPLTLAADGGDPGDAYWLRCDPVHLRTQRGQLVLAESAAYAPTPDEARALIATLNAHFAQDNLAFQARHPARWYLGVEHTPALVTQSLADVVGRDIDRYLPAGNDGLRWNRMLNEIQMLLHDHPVNQARGTTGKPAINSVWLWGGGVKPATRTPSFAKVWSDDVLALALAATCGIQARPLADDADPLVGAATGSAGSQLAVLPQLRDAIHTGNPDHWRAMLYALDKNWFAPLCSALRRRRLTGLALVVPGEQNCRCFDISGGDLWKFWRPIRDLGHYA